MFDKRIKKIKNLRKDFIEKGLDAVLISSVSNIIYLTGFAGFSKEEREAYVLITKNERFILTDGRYTEAVKREIPHFELLDRTGKSLKIILNKIKAKNLGVEEDNLTIEEYKAIKKHFKKINHFNLKTHRKIKNAEEIKKIEKACKLGDNAFNFILRKIKPGISEKQLAFELEIFVKKQGGNLSFPIIAAFGKNTSVPHHQTGNSILHPSTHSVRSGPGGQIILLDFGVKKDNYCSDMTRTIFLGKPNNEQEKIYKTVLEAQQKAVDYINSILKSGKKLKASDVDKVARRQITSKGYPTIPHSLGHGIGLEVHEHPGLSPKSKEELQEGMVFSIEPGIYLPGFGGVRIEDLYVIKEGKLKQITKSSKKVISI